MAKFRAGAESRWDGSKLHAHSITSECLLQGSNPQVLPSSLLSSHLLLPASVSTRLRESSTQVRAAIRRLGLATPHFLHQIPWPAGPALTYFRNSAPVTEHFPWLCGRHCAGNTGRILALGESPISGKMGRSVPLFNGSKETHSLSS